MSELYRLNREMIAANALREALGTDDDDLLRDSIEGETDLHEMIAATVTSMDEDTMLADGLANRIYDLKTRAARIEKRIATKRAAIEQAMVIGDLKTLELPTITATVKRTTPGLQITDEAMIPEAYWKAKDPVLDKAALKKALKDGPIPGAQLDNGGVALQLRRN